MSTLSASAATVPPVSTLRGREVSLDYLRTSLTLLVVAHHSALAYITWASVDAQHPLRSAVPIADPHRWIGFDYAVHFNDAFFMSLMFFLSGLFVYAALRRQGVAGFIRDRCLRLALPFAVAVMVLMPLAFYASWKLTGPPEDFATYYQQLAREGFMVGPAWFIWVLLLFDMVVALLLRPWQWAARFIERAMPWTGQHVVLTCLLVFGMAVLVYFPLLLH
jgi:glucan biosynthesis protein C